jgi:acyl-CoA dehydrogenase
MCTDEDFKTLLGAVRSVSSQVAAVHAPDVDRQGRFPIETFEALKALRVLSAPVPEQFGGAGLSMLQLGQLCAVVSGACGSSGMVLAMHYIQVACIARHHANEPFWADYLSEIVHAQPVLASITSEVGTFGDTRSSICAVQREGTQFALDKQATTGSYCAHSDAILVTCRRNDDAPRNDQALVLVRQSDAQLTQTTSWDTMGMRGTCSPGFDLCSRGDVRQILPVPYADISAQTMVPYSHILWAALWWGIANDAYAKAASYVRGEARKNPGTTPPTARRLARLSVELQSMKNNWQTVAREFDQLVTAGDESALLGMSWGHKFINLKVSASEEAPQIVHKALQIVGILGYKNDSPFSLGRHYRDVLSASLMVSNERIIGKSAAMVLVLKDE